MWPWPEFLGEMADFRSGAENTQEEPEIIFSNTRVVLSEKHGTQRGPQCPEVGGCMRENES